jgi:hypothetical protein
MNFKKYIFSLLILLFLFWSGCSLAAGTASINISPQSGSYKEGKTFPLTISIDPVGGKIDTVRAKLVFSPDLLRIKSFSTSPSFSFQTGSNGFDNNAGTFSWGAGIAGGTSSPAVFGTVIFEVLKQGDAKVSVERSSMVLASGEDKFNGITSSANFALLQKPEPQPVNTKTDIQPNPLENKVGQADNNSVETKIVTTEKPKDSPASLLGILPFRSVVLLWFAALILLALISLFVILQRDNQKSKKLKKH